MTELTDKLIADRQVARDINDYTMSDLIREELDSRNVFIIDTIDGQYVIFPSEPKTRDQVLAELKEENRLNKLFDAWLYSQLNEER